MAASCAVLLGLAFELYEPPSQAMIADATAPPDRAHAFGLLTTALAAGNTGAGLLADVVGRSNLRWLFVIDAITCLACALIVRFGLPGDRPQALRGAFRSRRAALRPGGAGPVPDPAPWRDRALLAVTAGGTVYALIYMLMVVGLPLSLAADGRNPAQAGLVMAASTVTLLIARPLLRTGPLALLPAPAAFAAGYVLMALGLGGYVVAHSVPGLLAPTIAWSIGNLLLTGRAFAVVTDLAPPGAAARYLAVFGLSWGVATVAAPVLATQVIALLGSGALWAADGALCLLMAAVQPALLASVARHKAIRTQADPASPVPPTIKAAAYGS